jgi:hypothetical protein
MYGVLSALVTTGAPFISLAAALVNGSNAVTPTTLAYVWNGAKEINIKPSNQGT